MKMIQQYQKQLESLDKTEQKNHFLSEDMAQRVNEDKPKNTNLEKYLTKQEKAQDQEQIDELTLKKIEMKNRIKDLFKQKRSNEEEKQIEKESTSSKNYTKNRADEMQTPKKNLDQVNKNIYGNNYNDQPPVPQYITGSMRKIRKSPPLAENEEVKVGDSPNSIIPNNYEDDEKNKTVYRLKGSSIDMDDIKAHQIDPNPIKSIKNEVPQETPQNYEEENDENFKPDPDLLARLNENMRKNDVLEVPVYKFKETEEQKKKREQREKIEREREIERQRLFQILNDPDNSGIYWGGEEESEPENDEEQK